jgi:hypothetical protein
MEKTHAEVEQASLVLRSSREQLTNASIVLDCMGES